MHKMWLPILIPFMLPAYSIGQTLNEQVPWYTLEFQASHLFVSGKLQFKLTDMTAAQAKSQMLDTEGQNALNPDGEKVSLLHVHSKLMSNRGDMHIWMDSDDYRVLQRVRMTAGSESRLKQYRYLKNAVYRVRRESESDDLGLDSTAWKTSSEQVIALPAASAPPHLVRDPSTLLLLASNSALKKSGDSLSTTIFTDKQAYTATMTVEETVPIKVKYRQTDYSGSHTVAAQLDTLKIRIKTELLGSEPEEEIFEFLGLNEPVFIYVDAKSRLPLQVEGRQNRVGKVTVDLRKVTLRSK